MDELEKMKKGYLWNDCEQYLEEQRVAKELLYDFNQSRPSEIEKRTEIIKKLFGHCGKDVWINQPMALCRGTGAIVLAGVTIGENSVIGAGSVVTKDIPANVLAVGSPCKVLREFNENDKEYYHKNLRFDQQNFED